MLLQVNSLGKSFEDGRDIFREINFSVDKGEFVSIVGASGCGKSTLLNIIANLLQASRGEIKFNNDHDKSDRIMIFQEYNKTLFPWKTVFQNIDFVLRNVLSVSDRQLQSEKYLQLVRLEEARNKYPWQLSGGMQQRVAIARALATEPKLLLMDEPFGSLDANIRRELELELLSLWKKLNITILFVTHDIDEAIFLSNRILVMKGTPSTIADIVSIDIPYPRDYIKTKNSNSFGEYRTKLMQHFQ